MHLCVQPILTEARRAVPCNEAGSPHLYPLAKGEPNVPSLPIPNFRIDAGITVARDGSTVAFSASAICVEATSVAVADHLLIKASSTKL